jgi:hypothetical protein
VAQHLEALQRANVVRLARAELKRAIKNRDVGGAEVLLGEIPEWLEEMRVEDLCNAIPRFSWRAYQQVMQEAGAGLSLTIGALTTRQRQAIGVGLAEWETAADERRRARTRRRANGLPRSKGMAA